MELSKLLRLISDRISIVRKLCSSASEQEIIEKSWNIIEKKFNKIRNEVEDEEVIGDLLKSLENTNDTEYIDLSLEIRFEGLEKCQKGYYRLIHECGEAIRKRSYSEFKRSFIRLYKVIKLLRDQDVEEHLKDLEILAQIDDVCAILRRFREFDISIEDSGNLAQFTEELMRLKWKGGVYYDIHRTALETIEVLKDEILGDDWTSCMLYLYRLFKSVREPYRIYDLPNFLLLLFITSEVLKNEGLYTKQNLDKYILTFGKTSEKAFEKLKQIASHSHYTSTFDKDSLESMRRGLFNYLLSALRVSQAFNIDNEISYHTYILNKLLSSDAIRVEDFKKVADLYRIVVDELVKEKEYGDKYILSLLRLIVIAIIQQRLYRAPATLTESRFIQILLEIIKLVNKMCDKDAIKNFDKMLNYYIYSADLEYLEGFIDFLYSLYLRSDYEGFRNALKSLNFF